MDEAWGLFQDFALAGIVHSVFDLLLLGIGLQSTGCLRRFLFMAIAVGLLWFTLWGVVLGALPLFIPLWTEFLVLVVAMSSLRRRGWHVTFVGDSSNRSQQVHPEIFQCNLRTAALASVVALALAGTATWFRAPLKTPATRDEVGTAVFVWNYFNLVLVELNTIVALLTILGKRSLWWGVCAPVATSLIAAIGAAWPYAGAFVAFFGAFAGFQIGNTLAVAVALLVMRSAGFRLLRTDPSAAEPRYRSFVLAWPTAPAATARYQSFAEFWPSYVREHARPACRALQFLGCTVACAVAVLVLATHRSPLLLVAIYVFLICRGFAWLGRIFIESDQPATFAHPWWSFLADWKMCVVMLAGRMRAEVNKAMASKPPLMPDIVEVRGDEFPRDT